MKRLLFSLAILQTALMGCAENRQEKHSERPKFVTAEWKTCPGIVEAAKKEFSEIKNKNNQTLSQLLDLSPVNFEIDVDPSAWDGTEDATLRVQEVLNGYPMAIQSVPMWAEGTNVVPEQIVVMFRNGASMEVSGYHVCARDAEKRFWYFRTAKGDGWKN